jgi:NADH-quinone oxidoreductase subunit N
MDVTISFQDLAATAPLTIVSLTALVALLIDAFVPRSSKLLFWVAIAGLAAALATALVALPDRGYAYSGMVTVGGYASFLAVIFCVSGILSMLFSAGYLSTHGIEKGEYYVLMLLAIAGMILMASAADLVMFFLGLELMSVCFYVLAGFSRSNLLSNEAGLKYFLLGAFATGFLLYGIALIYGSTGSTSIPVLIASAAGLSGEPIFLIGLALLLIGLAFKVAAVPFHMWVPDVYEGAPTTVTGFMSTGGKAAAFSAFLIVFAPTVVGTIASLREVLAAIAVLSMVVGNVIAIAQTSVKRMLAYSSIAHAGYLLVGVVAGNAAGQNGVLFYLLAYTIMNVAAFGIVSILETREGKHLTFEEYEGLSTKQPLLAALMALFMFSLAGIPPFAGFFGKYYVFAGAVEAGYTWLAIVGVIMSVVSAYYYLRLSMVMYFREGVPGLRSSAPALAMVALVLSALGVIGLGLFPSTIVHLTVPLF